MWGTLMPFGSKAKFRGHRRHTLKDVVLKAQGQSRSNLFPKDKAAARKLPPSHSVSYWQALKLSVPTFFDEPPVTVTELLTKSAGVQDGVPSGSAAGSPSTA